MPKVKITESVLNNIQGPVELFDSIELGLIVRISENGTKSFSFRYVSNGKTRRFTFGRYPNISVSQARVKVQEFRNNLLVGKDPQTIREKRREEVITFEELAEEFKKKHFKGLRDSTINKYRRTIDNDLTPHFKDQPITQITKKQILEVLDSKAFDDESPTHANHMRGRLHTMYNFAIKRDLIDVNPISKIDKYKNGQNRRERYYSEDEIKAIWNYLPKLEEPTKYVFMMLFLTGQRKGETRQMEWKHIDLEERIWTIPAHLAKNNVSHQVPLSTGALWILKNLRDGFSRNSKYVFPSRYLDKDCPIYRIDASTRKIKNNTFVKDFRPHDIRRTVATYLAKMRVGRTVVGKILNHKGLSGDSSVTAIYDRYSYQDEKEEALQKWSDKLNKIISR